MQCKHFFTAIIAAALGFTAAAQATYVSPVWVSDNGNGTYKNPVLHADYSDPDAVRVGDDFYMTASSFNCTPGLPILHSRDLVNWRIVNYALKKQVPEDVFNIPQHGKGVWAPAIRYHNNEFYIYYPDPDFGIYMIRTKDPAKDWSEPVLVLAGKGYIDPCPLWDDNGKTYLIIGWAGSRAGINSILTIFQMNKEGTRTIGDGKHVYDGHGIDPTIEGPKFYKRNGFYYIFAPAGGVATGWQLALRSRNIYGPYERKVVMSQGASVVNGPHQGALVDTKSGEEWWFLHFQDKGPYGRVVHLQPVVWKNNWPVIGIDKDGDGNGDPVLEYKKPSVGKTYPIETPVESDEFNADSLGLQWQWHANPKIQWSAMIRGSNFLRLFAYPDSGRTLWSSSNLLLQKFPAPQFSATTKISFNVDSNAADGKKAGLLVMGSDYSYISIARNKQGYFLSQVICKDAMGKGTEQTIAEQPLQSGTVYLRVTVTPDGACTFSYSEDGINFKYIGQGFVAKEGRWIGAKVGLFCMAKAGTRMGGYADVDWFRISK